jgi:hypothetical protein
VGPTAGAATRAVSRGDGPVGPGCQGLYRVPAQANFEKTIALVERRSSVPIRQGALRAPRWQVASVAGTAPAHGFASSARIWGSTVILHPPGRRHPAHRQRRSRHRHRRRRPRHLAPPRRPHDPLLRRPRRTDPRTARSAPARCSLPRHGPPLTTGPDTVQGGGLGPWYAFAPWPTSADNRGSRPPPARRRWRRSGLHPCPGALQRGPRRQGHCGVRRAARPAVDGSKIAPTTLQTDRFPFRPYRVNLAV